MIIVCGLIPVTANTDAVNIQASCGHIVTISEQALMVAVTGFNVRTSCVVCIGGERGMRSIARGGGRIGTLPGALDEVASEVSVDAAASIQGMVDDWNDEVPREA